MSRRRLLVVLLIAIAFGCVAGWAKGPAGDGRALASVLRGDLGNLSAPWLVLPLLAGACCRRGRSGALLGLAATVVALVGFYVITALFVHLDGRGFLGSIPLWVRANRYYFEGGLVTGPLFGAIGARWLRADRRRTVLVAGLLMMAEPLVLLALGYVTSPGVIAPGRLLPGVVRLIPAWGVRLDDGTERLAVYLVEFAAGTALLARRLTRRPA